MGPFNRNVITQDDINNLKSAASAAQLPATLQADPPALVAAGAAQALAVVGGGGPPAAPLVGAPAAAPAAGPGGVAIGNADDYLTKLLKFVPLEVLSAYLFLDGVISSNVKAGHDRALWLGVLLVAMLVITVVYDRRVLNVYRGMQVAMSVVGLATYVFAFGGWFATTTWYQAFYGSIALTAYGLLVGIVKLTPLPPAG